MTTTSNDEVKAAFQTLHQKYNEHFPKVRPALLDNLLARMSENPSEDPMFMVEVFTKPGLDSEQVRKYILEKTGMAPSILDNGTHYATNQRLNLEILKEISDSDDVIAVAGEYTGRVGAYGPSHDHRELQNVGRQTGGRCMPPE